MAYEQKRNLVFIHGVRVGGNAEVGDFSAALRESLGNAGQVAVDANRWRNAYWADVAERYTDGWEVAAEMLVRLFGGELAFAAGVVGDAIDLVGDIFVYQNSNAAREVRAAVRAALDAQPNGVLAAHSLGSVVAYDIIAEDVAAGRYRGPKDTWPIRALVTFGSPLNLEMFNAQRRAPWQGTLSGNFYWYDYADRNDPVVTGNAFGLAAQPLLFERYQYHHPKLVLKDRWANSGFHLRAHTAYWRHPTLTQRIAQLVTT